MRVFLLALQGQFSFHPGYYANVNDEEYLIPYGLHPSLYPNSLSLPASMSNSDTTHLPVGRDLLLWLGGMDII